MSSRSAARRTSLLLAVLASFGASVGAGGPPRVLAPQRLMVNGRVAPLDLDLAPRFGWQVRQAEQSAYELRVASTRARAESARGDVWASGVVRSARQNDVAYAGPALEPGQRYFWVLRTRDEAGRWSPWSEVAELGTGPGPSWSSSQPIWASPSTTGWGDYRLEARLTIDEVALGLRFRAPNDRNGYMWQLRGADNRLVPHRLVDGVFSVIESVPLPLGALALGREAAVVIEAVGTTIRTSIDGALVHTLEDASFTSGGVGVRTGNTESGRLHALALVDVDGQALLETDFPTEDSSFGCGRVEASGLRVGRATHCSNAGASVDWAFLRKEFTLADRPIAWATAYATGASPLPAKQYVYKLYLNGAFVGLGPTHSLGPEARYDGFDVGELLVPGAANSLAVVAYATSGQAFQSELVVTYADGATETIGSDRSWKGAPGDLALPPAGSIGTSYYAAPRENLDARRFPHGFHTPGFDDQRWRPAAERAGLGELRAAPMAKVTEQHHAAAEIVEKGPGHYFIDFGRTWVGGVRYDVENGVAGANVDVRFGEVTSAPHTVRHQLEAGNTYQDTYTLRAGPQAIATWGMRVFRYLEIQGAPEPITSRNLAALALVYPFDASASTFSASDPELERVWQLSKNSIEALNVNFYTDSWTRERTNYEADAYLQQLSASYLSDDLSLAQYSMDYFASRRTWPTEWPLYTILAVHDAWRHSGSTQQLARSYEGLRAKLPEAWFEEETQLIRKLAGSNGCNSSTDCDIVDWPASLRDGFVFRQYNTVVNALAMRAYADMASMAAALGRADDEAAYTERARALRGAINAHLYDSELGRYDDGLDENRNRTFHHSLHASAFALAFGVPDASEAPRVAEYVASRGMAGSVYAAPFVIGGLYRAGGGHAALGLLGGSGLSSWVNMLRLGAGATAEAWDPSFKSNLTYSHPWAASPAFLIPSGLFGISALEPGYASFRLQPAPGGLDHASVVVPSARGPIGAAFNHGPDGLFQLSVQVPGNSRAELVLPVPEGAETVYVDGAPRAVQPAQAHVVLGRLGAGCHIVSFSAASEAHRDSELLEVCRSPPERGGSNGEHTSLAGCAREAWLGRAR